MFCQPAAERCPVAAQSGACFEVSVAAVIEAISGYELAARMAHAGPSAHGVVVMSSDIVGFAARSHASTAPKTATEAWLTSRPRCSQ